MQPEYILSNLLMSFTFSTDPAAGYNKSFWYNNNNNKLYL